MAVVGSVEVIVGPATFRITRWAGHVHATFVSRVDGFEGQHGTPRTLGGEPVTRFDKQRIERGCRHVAPQPLAESWLVRGSPGLRSLLLFTEAVRDGAACSV